VRSHLNKSFSEEKNVKFMQRSVTLLLKSNEYQQYVPNNDEKFRPQHAESTFTLTCRTINTACRRSSCDGGGGAGEREYLPPDLRQVQRVVLQAGPDHSVQNSA
jgi:hypothetical protein